MAALLFILRKDLGDVPLIVELGGTGVAGRWHFRYRDPRPHPSTKLGQAHLAILKNVFCAIIHIFSKLINLLLRRFRGTSVDTIVAKRLRRVRPTAAICRIEII